MKNKKFKPGKTYVFVGKKYLNWIRLNFSKSELKGKHFKLKCNKLNGIVFKYNDVNDSVFYEILDRSIFREFCKEVRVKNDKTKDKRNRGKNKKVRK